MKKTPFIWLQEKEDFGEASCGCVLERRPNGSAFIMCKAHQSGTMKRIVKIRVKGGVAEVLERPLDVQVIIDDQDGA